MPHPFEIELANIRQRADWAANQARLLAQHMERDRAAQGRIQQASEAVNRELTDLRNVIAAMKIDRIGGDNGNPDIQRIENIPGRRVPFDLLVEIPIDADTTSEQPGTITISQEGPFVAVGRYIAFLSQFQFQITDPETEEVATFLGRSHGRFRPTHSASDFLDAQLPADTVRLVAFPGTGDPSYSSPALHSPFRSMEFDARIVMRNQGSSFPRGNIAVPSTFWTTFVNNPFPLGCLDFFGRAEVIEFAVTPQHPSNPAVGNLTAFAAGGVYPFADAQYDHHEGVADPLDPALTSEDDDPATRLPAGVVIIGLHGYRIIQPPGAVVNIPSV